MARDVNKVMLSGRLGKDVEAKITPSGASVVTFSVASGRNVKDGEVWKEQTEWFRVVAWNTLADRCAQLLKKGSHVFIEGRLQTREWEDRQSGQKRHTTEVIASEMYLLDAKRANEADAAQPGLEPTEAELEAAGIPF